MRALLLSSLLAFTLSTKIFAADDYVPGPDSKDQPGVPKGEVTKYTFDHSKSFPGTTRTYWVYVPKQYDPATPACVMVFQDGLQYSATNVLNNLIARKEVPPIIGVFVTPGVVKAVSPNALDRFNRSYEYDGLGDNYARFLLEELLPEVAQKYNLSTNANDRAIAGASSGAIAAFTVAWERPDAFRRVFSSIGTYVGLRGGNNYPTLVRMTEPKPIRIFLQDGENDLNIYGGNWHLANEEMLSALEFSGYEVNHIWGDGQHNGKHATAIFPDALRWLWKDWPAQITAGNGSKQPVMDILIPGEDWQVASSGHRMVDGPTANAADADCNDLAVTHEGGIYFTDHHNKKVWFINAQHEKRLADEGIAFPNGIRLTPDQSLLLVSDTKGQFVYSFQVEPDGSLADKQRFFDLHMVDGSMQSGADGMTVDTEGRLYVTTEMGVQICDQAGRVQCIIPKPQRTGSPAVAFGGADRKELYVACGGTLYKRKTKATGVLSFEAPIKPPTPRL